MSNAKRTLEQHLAPGAPKRILALDGGGLRGILTLGILDSIERELRQRHGNDDAFRLSDYFDSDRRDVDGCDHRRYPRTGMVGQRDQQKVTSNSGNVSSSAAFSVKAFSARGTTSAG